jgi:hypothetical protein
MRLESGGWWRGWPGAKIVWKIDQGNCIFKKIKWAKNEIKKREK